MSEQSTMFDFIDIATDEIRMGLENLQIGETVKFGDIEVFRDKYYTVSKGNDFEEWFSDIDRAYSFINLNS